MHQIIENFRKGVTFIWSNGERKWSEFTNATKFELKEIVSHILIFNFYETTSSIAWVGWIGWVF